MIYARLEVYSHFVKVCDITEEARRPIGIFQKKVIQYELVKRPGRKMIFDRVPGRAFSAETRDGTEFRCHVNQLEDLIFVFGECGIRREQLDVVYMDLYDAKDAELVFDPKKTPRDYQIPVIDYLIAPGNIKTITMQTGTGKTATSLFAASKVGKRLLIMIPGKYFEKWIGDVKEAFPFLTDDRIIAVRGSKQLYDLLNSANDEEFEFDVVVITSTTLRNYIKLYEIDRFANLPTDIFVPPEQIYARLKIGVRILDEVHENFHANYCADLYTHLHKGIYLSATLESDDRFTNNMYLVAYPMDTRMNSGAYVKYAEVLAIHYDIDHETKKIRCSGHGGKYSHTEYEKWLLKHKTHLANYLRMIEVITKREYVAKRVDSQRMLIFAATVEMCGVIRDHLRQTIPGLNINKYNSEDDYEILMTSDISISTLGSSGTAVDIADLLVCLMTTALSKQQANLQALGRLRQLFKYPDQRPLFIYLACVKIRKHLDYCERKREMFRERVVGHRKVFFSGKI